MRIIETYSHLNGLEFLLVHHPELWQEIKKVTSAVNADNCKTKISREKTKKGKLLYSPTVMNEKFKTQLIKKQWQESRISSG